MIEHLLAQHGLNQGAVINFLVVVLLVIGFVVMPVIVLCSRRVRGGKKFGYFLISLLLPFLGFAVFLITAPPAQK
jgi:uncharacterized membrane protein YhaH (DUF805 family)